MSGQVARSRGRREAAAQLWKERTGGAHKGCPKQPGISQSAMPTVLAAATHLVGLHPHERGLAHDVQRRVQLLGPLVGGQLGEGSAQAWQQEGRKRAR